MDIDIKYIFLMIGVSLVVAFIPFSYLNEKFNKKFEEIEKKQETVEKNVDYYMSLDIKRLERSFKSSQENLLEIEDRVNSNNEEIKEIREKLAFFLSKLDELESKTSDLVKKSDLSKSLVNLEDKLSSLSEDLERLKKDFGCVKKICSSESLMHLENLNKDLEKLKQDFYRFHITLSDLSSSIELVEKNLIEKISSVEIELSDTEQSVGQVDLKVAFLERRYRDIKTTLENLIEEIQYNSGKITSLERNFGDLKNSLEKRLNEVKRSIEFLQDDLKGFSNLTFFRDICSKRVLLTYTGSVHEGYYYHPDEFIKIDFPGYIMIDLDLYEWSGDYSLDIVLLDPAGYLGMKNNLDVYTLAVKKIPDPGHYKWKWRVVPGYFMLVIDNTNWLSKTDVDGSDDIANFKLEIIYECDSKMAIE